MNSKYFRVIPRDFFNESKLLKCLGQLSLKILDCQLPEGIKVEIEETGEPFRVALTDDGLLTVVNYPIKVNDCPVIMGTTYNSKSNYQLKCVVDYVEYEVFDDAGEFTEEFKEFASQLV